MKCPSSLIVFITFCLLHESIAQQFYYSEENEDFPYSVPILPSENLEWFLVKDPEYFKLVMFVGTDFDRFCRACAISVCYLNEVMWHVDHNALGLCSEEDAQNGIRDVFNYRRSREVIKAAIIVVRKPDFLRVHKVTGVPQIRLYKPNGEMLDYRGQLVTARYFSNTLRLRDFVAETVFGESIFHPCTDYLVSDYQNTTYYPGFWGVYCKHIQLPLKQHMSNAGTYPNEINRIHDMRYKKGMIDSAEDAW